MISALLNLPLLKIMPENAEKNLQDVTSCHADVPQPSSKNANTRKKNLNVKSSMKKNASVYLNANAKDVNLNTLLSSEKNGKRTVNVAITQLLLKTIPKVILGDTLEDMLITTNTNGTNAIALPPDAVV